MNGSNYVATVRLSTKADETLAEPGDRCDRVPVEALPWLLRMDPPAITLAPAQPETEE